MARHEVLSRWVELRDPDRVPERLRRPVFQKSVEGVNVSFDENNVNPEAMVFFSEFNDLLAIAMVESWSFDSPVSIDGLLDLDKKTYDEIRSLVSPFVQQLMPDFGISPDPKVTTEP